MNLSGSIKSITTQIAGGNGVKKLVEVRLPGSQFMFVEFTGKTREQLAELSTGDMVTVTFAFKGHVNRANKPVNSLEGKKIIKINSLQDYAYQCNKK